MTTTQHSLDKQLKCQRRHGFAVTALVLGIIGTVLGFVPILFVLALPLGVLALTFGVLAWCHGKGKAGAILGVVALALGIIGYLIVNDAFNHVDHCVNDTTIGQDGTLHTPQDCK